MILNDQTVRFCLEKELLDSSRQAVASAVEWRKDKNHEQDQDELAGWLAGFLEVKCWRKVCAMWLCNRLLLLLVCLQTQSLAPLACLVSTFKAAAGL